MPQNKIANPGCRSDAGTCAHASSCRITISETSNLGRTHHCFVAPRPPYTGRLARVAYGDGAHCSGESPKKR